mgnify:CR=1 FL=1
MTLTSMLAAFTIIGLVLVSIEANAQTNTAHPGVGLETLLKPFQEGESGSSEDDDSRAASILDWLGCRKELPVTNEIDRILFAPQSPYRPVAFFIRPYFSMPNERNLGRQVVCILPHLERQTCYVTALKHLDFRRVKGTRLMAQADSLLQDCAMAETDGDLAALLDKGLAANASGWAGRNARKHVAVRHAKVAGDAGGYFRAVLVEIGPPLKPSLATVVSELCDVYFCGTDGISIEEQESHQRLNIMRFAQDHNMTEPEAVHLMADALRETLQKKETDERGRLHLYCLITALSLSRGFDTEGVLLDAAFSEWNPDRHACLLGLFRIASPQATLNAVRRVIDDKTKFTTLERNGCYKKLAELAGYRETERTDVQNEIVSFLRASTEREQNSSICHMLDVKLLNILSDWKNSEERKKLAARFADQGDQNAIGSYFREVLKMINSPQREEPK